MRTTVYTDAQDTDVTDEFPGCFGTAAEDGSLSIVDYDTSDVEEQYSRGEWVGYETWAD